MRTRFLKYVLIGLTCFWVLSGVVQAEPAVQKLQLPTHQEMKVEKAIFSSDGRKLAVYCQQIGDQRRKDQVIFIYDFLTKQWVRAVERSQGFVREIEPLALDQNGQRLAYRDGEDLIVLDLTSYRQLHKVEAAGSMTQATFAKSGDQLAFLMTAEWELPTSLYLLDLSSGHQKRVAKYSGDTKAAGPLYWNEHGLYFLEEFTWGTINARGILKSYQTHKDKVLTVYQSPWESTRVSDYFISPNGQYLAMMLREFDDSLEKSEYGLVIQQAGSFVYGAKVADWQDRTDPHISTDPSLGGWIGNEQFYWINRKDQVYNLHLYNLQTQEQVQYQYNQPVLVTPYGEIIMLGR